MAYEFRDSQAGRPKGAASVSTDALPNSEDLSNAAAGAAHRACEALASGAHYVREREVADTVDDLVGVVRNNPGPALLCAGALGFVIGRAIYRN